MTTTVALAALLFAQTLAGVYGSQTDEVWDWFASATLPTLTLMIGAAAASSSIPDPPPAQGVVYRLAQLTGGAYLASLGIVIVLMALGFTTEPLTHARLPLKFFYALATAFVGVFFVSARGSVRPVDESDQASTGLEEG